MDELLRPVWAEINLDNLRHNVGQVRALVGAETKICGVVKADAYGHGAIQVGAFLVANGVDYLAVATLTEAIQLRKSGIQIPILILGYTPLEYSTHLLTYQLTQTIYGKEQAAYLSQLASEKNQPVSVHIKIDTGMARIGFQCNQTSLNEIKHIFRLPKLVVEGVYTHFAMADAADKASAYQQYDRFMDFIQNLEAAGCSIPIKHACNSAAIIDLPEMKLDMVRAGIMLYGLYPSAEVNHEQVRLKPVMSLKARVAHVKEVPPDQGISYGWIYKTKTVRKIATLPLGYADGFTRLLTNKAVLTIEGQQVPIVGRICMDQMMADITGLSLKEGDQVTIFYDDPDQGVTVEDFANKLDTISYEVVCSVGKRVPRVYMENNGLLQVFDSLLE